MCRWPPLATLENSLAPLSNERIIAPWAMRTASALSTGRLKNGSWQVQMMHDHMAHTGDEGDGIMGNEV